MALAVGILLTIEQIGDRTISALQAESPEGLNTRLVKAIVDSVGPLVVALVGSAFVCVVYMVNQFGADRRNHK